MIALLVAAVVLLFLHHVYQGRRDRERDARWERKIDAIAEGFKALEHIVTGSIRQRTGFENTLTDHETRIRRLEEQNRERTH